MDKKIKMEFDERILLYVVIFLLFLAFSFNSVKADSSSSLLHFSNWSLMPTDMVLLPDPARDITWNPADRVSSLQSNTVWPSQGAPEVVDQGEWGSCTAFSMRYAYLLWLKKHNPAVTVIEPSTAYWYAKSRRLIFPSGTLKDTGSTTSATVSIVTSSGTPSNAAWLYTAPSIFADPPNTLIIPPPVTGITSPYTFTANGNFAGFKQLPSVAGIGANPKWQNQAELFISEINAGRAILSSINVFSNLTTQTLITGVFPSPSGKALGGHAICLIGYVRGATYADSVFTFYNSWGLYSGFYNNVPGLFSIPFSYVANSSYAGDWWSL